MHLTEMETEVVVRRSRKGGWTAEARLGDRSWVSGTSAAEAGSEWALHKLIDYLATELAEATK